MFQEPWRMWLKTEASPPPPPPPASLPGRPGIKMLGAEEEKESNVTLKKEQESLISMYSHISMK